PSIFILNSIYNEGKCSNFEYLPFLFVFEWLVIFDNRNDKALRLEGHLACAIYIAKCLFCFVKYDGWLVWTSLLFIDMHFSI
ncbi:hypothetical protein QI477_13280, partial [Staphylococcus aureus]|uniref:hypothetical protein n=5 Tax=Staphylococcus aureus TaxID=1280 RepID=UPI00053B148B